MEDNFSMAGGGGRQEVMPAKLDSLIPATCPVPNKPQTGTGPWPWDWGSLIIHGVSLRCAMC